MLGKHISLLQNTWAYCLSKISKVPVRCNGSRKKNFMTLENNMLAFIHFLRALSLHIWLSCSSTNYVDEEKKLAAYFQNKKIQF
jgi:hypothetical protein